MRKEKLLISTRNSFCLSCFGFRLWILWEIHENCNKKAITYSPYEKHFILLLGGFMTFDCLMTLFVSLRGKTGTNESERQTDVGSN